MSFSKKLSYIALSITFTACGVQDIQSTFKELEGNHKDMGKSQVVEKEVFVYYANETAPQRGELESYRKTLQLLNNPGARSNNWVYLRYALDMQAESAGNSDHERRQLSFAEVVRQARDEMVAETCAKGSSFVHISNTTAAKTSGKPSLQVCLPHKPLISIDLAASKSAVDLALAKVISTVQKESTVLDSNPLSDQRVLAAFLKWLNERFPNETYSHSIEFISHAKNNYALTTRIIPSYDLIARNYNQNFNSFLDDFGKEAEALYLGHKKIGNSGVGRLVNSNTVGKGDDANSVGKGDDANSVGKGDDANSVGKGDDANSVGKGDDANSVGKGDDANSVGKGDDANSVGKSGIGSNILGYIDLGEGNLGKSMSQAGMTSQEFIDTLAASGIDFNLIFLHGCNTKSVAAIANKVSFSSLFTSDERGLYFNTVDSYRSLKSNNPSFSERLKDELNRIVEKSK